MTTDPESFDEKPEPSNEKSSGDNPESFGEEQFQDFLNNYQNAEPEIKEQVVWDFVQSIYEEIYQRARYYLYGKAANVKATSPSSLRNRAVLSLIGLLPEKLNQSAFENIDKFWAYFRLILSSRVMDIYRVEVKKKAKLEQYAEGKKDYADPVESTGQEFLDVLFHMLEPHEIDLLMERFVNELSYPEIKEKFEIKITDAGLRQKVERILDRIRKNLKLDFPKPDDDPDKPQTQEA